MENLFESVGKTRGIAIMILDIFEDMLSAFFYDEHDKHGDVEGVECYDGQFIILEGDDSGELSADETEFPLEHPYYRDGKADESGSDGHIALLIKL